MLSKYGLILQVRNNLNKIMVSHTVYCMANHRVGNLQRISKVKTRVCKITSFQKIAVTCYQYLITAVTVNYI